MALRSQMNKNFGFVFCDYWIHEMAKHISIKLILNYKNTHLYVSPKHEFRRLILSQFNQTITIVRSMPEARDVSGGNLLPSLRYVLKQ